MSDTTVGPARAGHRPRSPAGWERAVREHRAALVALLDTVERVGEEPWSRPLGAGQWSPAEIAEHLALVYEAILAELANGTGMRARVGPVTQRLLRWVLLPHILFHRSFPIRARSPREARPSSGGLDRDAVAQRLSTLAEQVERELAAAPGARITHPYFGSLRPAAALRFCAVHMDHHRRQVERAAGPTG